MAGNLLDYMATFGSSSFDECPLNPIDMLILNELGYLPLGEGLDFQTDYQLKDLSDLSRITTVDFLTTVERLELFDAVVVSRRFDNLILKDYVNEVDVDFEKQFAALIWCIPSLDYHQVVFRGTDDTLIGWKEDFNLTYMREIPAQRRAVVYLEHFLTQHQVPVVVSGHSKGGNLALYATSLLKTNLQDLIQFIYVLDAPGLHSSVLESEGYYRIKPLVLAIRPQDAIVGVMLAHDVKPIIVASKKIGIEQHNVINWQIDQMSFEIVDKGTMFSDILADTFEEWTDTLSNKELKTYIDTLFDTLDSSGITSLNDFESNGLQKLNQIREQLHELPIEKRKLLRQSTASLVKTFLDRAFNTKS